MAVVDLPSPGMTPRLAAARQYVSMGLSVLPWSYQGSDKTPTRKYAVGTVPPMTLAEINDWWYMHQTDNVGVITGPTQLGLVVGPCDIVGVDLDTEEAKRWAKAHLPTTPWRTLSGREAGGEHWVYRYPTDLPPGAWIKNGANVMGIRGLDIRGKGGYLAMPPSLHRSGREYAWLSRPLAVDDLPDFNPEWFPGHNCLKSPEEDGEEVDGARVASAEAMQEASAWLATIPPAIEGQGGDKHTFMVAAALRRGYGLSQMQALEVIAPWNALCQPPWEDDKLSYKLSKGFSEGSEALGGRLTGAVDRFLAGRLGAKNTRDNIRTPPESEVVVAEPPKTMQEVASAILAARRWALEVVSKALGNPEALYTDEALAHADLLSRKDAGAFARLRSELKMLRISLKDWEKKVKQMGPAQERARMLSDTLAREKRAKVSITGDEMAVCNEILKVLATVPTLFQYGGSLAHITNEGTTFLVGDALHNVILQVILPVKATPDKSTGDMLYVPVPLPSNIVKILSKPLPEQLAQFRPVRRIARFPFCVQSDVEDTPRLVVDPGYDPFSKTLLVQCPPIDIQDFPTVQSAVEYLTWVWSDFPWEGEAEWQNYLGMLVSLAVRGMVDGAMPMLLIEANSKKAGKSLLAEAILLLAGIDPPKMTPWPESKEKMSQAIFAALSNLRTVLVWDNVRGKVDSTEMELMLTAREYEVRVLHSSRTAAYPCDQLTVLAANNARFTAEGARRVARARLLLPPNGDNRRFKIDRIRQYWSANRGRIWSAVCRLLQHWIEEGAEVREGLPKVPSYEAWRDIVGSIMFSAGLTDWMSNQESTQDSISDDSDWESFVQAWWEKGRDKVMTALDLWALACSKGMLGDVMGDGGDRSQQTKLGSALNYLKDSHHGQWQIRVVRKPGTGNLYKLEEYGKVMALTAPSDAVTLDDVRG